MSLIIADASRKVTQEWLIASLDLVYILARSQAVFDLLMRNPDRLYTRLLGMFCTHADEPRVLTSLVMALGNIRYVHIQRRMADVSSHRCCAPLLLPAHCVFAS